MTECYMQKRWLDKVDMKVTWVIIMYIERPSLHNYIISMAPIQSFTLMHSVVLLFNCQWKWDIYKHVQSKHCFCWGPIIIIAMLKLFQLITIMCTYIVSNYRATYVHVVRWKMSHYFLQDFHGCTTTYCYSHNNILSDMVGGKGSWEHYDQPEFLTTTNGNVVNIDASVWEYRGNA